MTDSDREIEFTEREILVEGRVIEVIPPEKCPLCDDDLLWRPGRARTGKLIVRCGSCGDVIGFEVSEEEGEVPITYLRVAEVEDDLDGA